LDNFVYGKAQHIYQCFKGLGSEHLDRCLNCNIKLLSGGMILNRVAASGKRICHQQGGRI